MRNRGLPSLSLNAEVRRTATKDTSTHVTADQMPATDERREGLSFVNPLSIFWRQTVSLRVRNFQTERSKVNDAGGSPIIIAATLT